MVYGFISKSQPDTFEAVSIVLLREDHLAEAVLLPVLKVAEVEAPVLVVQLSIA